MRLLSLDDERERDAEQRERLDQTDADEHRGADLTRVLGLTRHGLDGLADQDAQPMPGPIAASPMTSPRPIVARPSQVSGEPARADANMLGLLVSVLLGHRAADVGGGEDGEDERLKSGHEDLEADEHDGDRERERGEDRPSKPPCSMATVPRKNTASRKCPATKLAQSRTDRVIGRMMIWVMNSIGTSST